MDMKLEVLFVPVSDVDRAKRFYEKLGFRLDLDRRQRGLPGDTIHSSRFGGVNHLRQGDHFRPARLDRSPSPGGVRHRRCPRLLDRPRRRRERGFPLCRGPFQQRRGESARQRAQPARSFLPIICLVRGSRRERLAGPGDPDAASRPRVELDTTTGHGRCNLGRAPPRDGRAP